MFLKSLSLVISLILISCAKPNYQESKVQPDLQSSFVGECVVQFEKSKLCVHFNWEKMQTSRDDLGVFTFRVFKKSSDQFPELVDLNPQPYVHLWMDMGHGSTKDVVTERLRVGTYRASNVFFTMEGPWEIHLQLREGKEVLDEALIQYTYLP